MAWALDFWLGGRQTDVFVRVQKLAPVDPSFNYLTTKPIKSLMLLLCLK
jgi:hypothetical protein